MSNNQRIRQFVLRSPKWIVGVLVLAILATTALQAHAALTQADSLGHTPVVAPQVVDTSKAVSQSTTGVAAVTATGTKTPASILNCTPASYTAPGMLALNTFNSGLSEVTEPTNYYQIYGNTTTDIAQQLTKCAPKIASEDNQDFVGYSSYAINWQYTYLPQADGRCAIQDVKIGLHLGGVRPTWQQGPSTSAAVAANWQRFITALNTHEDGHIALDRQYAAQLLADLKQQPPTTCASIGSVLDSVIQHDLVALAQANDNYDAQTHHGATQGAVLILQ